MAYKLERNLFLDGVEYSIGSVIDLPDDDRTKSLVESGTLSETSDKATASADANKEVDNSTSPLGVSEPAGQPEVSQAPTAVQPTDGEITRTAESVAKPSTPAEPASSETTSQNLHLG